MPGEETGINLVSRLRQKRNTTCVFEILMAGLLADLGVRFSLSPEILAASNMGIIAKTLGVNFISTACLFVGVTRICSMLFENVLSPWGVHVRLALTVASGFLWGSFVAGFFETFFIQGRALPPGFDMLLTQAIGEFVVALQLSKEIR